MTDLVIGTVKKKDIFSQKYGQVKTSKIEVLLLVYLDAFTNKRKNFF